MVYGCLQAPVKCTRVRSVDCFDPNRSRAPTAITSRHQSAARRITRSAPKRGASCRTTRTRSRRGHASEYAVNLGGHDEVVLMQSLDLLGLQRDRRIAPTEADIRMMAFSFRKFTNLLNKDKRLPEIAKPEAPLDAVSFLRQLPVRGLCVKELSLLAREWRYSPRQRVQVLLAKASVMQASSIEEASWWLIRLTSNRSCRLSHEPASSIAVIPAPVDP